MRLLKAVKANPGATAGWVAGFVAFLAFLPNVSKGWDIFKKQIDAPVVAAEAKQVAEEAKTTAIGVNDRFHQYLEQQQQAIETQNKVAEAIADYAKQNQEMQQQVYVAPQPVWLCECDEVGPDCWQCESDDRQHCFDQGLWYRVERCP